MKRTFFNPTHYQVLKRRESAPYMGRRSLRFGSACFRNDGTPDEDPEKLALLNAMKEQVKTQLTEKGLDTLSKDKVDVIEKLVQAWDKAPIDVLKALADPETGISKIVEKQGVLIEQLMAGGTVGGKKYLSIREQLSAWKDKGSKFTTDDGTVIDQPAAKEALAKRRLGGSVDIPAFELELTPLAATSPMTPANTFTGDYPAIPVPNIDYTLNEIPRNQLTLWDTLVKGRSGSPIMVWINKTNPQGAAGFIAPGVLKPLISFEIETGTTSAKKVADAAKVALETLEDIDQFESWLRDELRYQVLLAVNTALMTGDGIGDNPTGIQNLSVAYTTTGIATTNPTYVDALRAVVAQMRSGNLQGEIDIFINPIDSANMDIAKATDSGVYLLPPFVTASGRTVAGARVREDANIPVGYFQAAFLRYYRILIYKPLVITFGWENDDFRRNLLTYLCEMRFLQAFNEQYTGAFVYDSFANVITAITA